MIVDVLPNQYEAIANKYHFSPWQSGLLADLVFPPRNYSQFLSINMGRSAGHTYFARTAASHDFPSRTKVYVSRNKHIGEYSSLLFDETKVHEPIEPLDQDDFSGYSGQEVDFVIVDMGFEDIKPFEQAIGKIKRTISSKTRILLMQANFSNLFDKMSV